MKFSTIENAAYWLERKWPVSDAAQVTALKQVQAAMECMVTVTDARHAFAAAAKSAGFTPLR